MASKKLTTKNVAEALSPRIRAPKEPNHLGLSFMTNRFGFKLVPDVLLVTSGIIDVLMDCFEAEMMKKRIEGEYKGYAIKNTIMTALYTINCSNITNDRGDYFEDVADFEPYNYEEESKEPAPAARDNVGRNTVLNRPGQLKFRLNTE